MARSKALLVADNKRLRRSWQWPFSWLTAVRLEALKAAMAEVNSLGRMLALPAIQLLCCSRRASAKLGQG